MPGRKEPEIIDAKFIEIEFDDQGREVRRVDKQNPFNFSLDPLVEMGTRYANKQGIPINRDQMAYVVKNACDWLTGDEQEKEERDTMANSMSRAKRAKKPKKISQVQGEDLDLIVTVQIAATFENGVLVLLLDDGEEYLEEPLTTLIETWLNKDPDDEEFAVDILALTGSEKKPIEIEISPEEIKDFEFAEFSEDEDSDT